MDFSAQLDELQQRAAAAKAAAQAAATESREQLRQRIDQAQVDVNLAVKDAKQQAGEAAASARSRWAQMKADAAAKMDDVKAKIDKRADQLDARAAADDADWVEANAADAIDYAEWTVDNARLAVLDAIDARIYANELAQTAGSAFAPDLPASGPAVRLTGPVFTRRRHPDRDDRRLPGAGRRRHGRGPCHQTLHHPAPPRGRDLPGAQGRGPRPLVAVAAQEIVAHEPFYTFTVLVIKALFLKGPTPSVSKSGGESWTTPTRAVHPRRSVAVRPAWPQVVAAS